MARPLRIEYEGAVYHITSRGNAQADIYLSDMDRAMFLDVLAHVVDRFGWICHAYCLMSNHYHLMIETPQSNLSKGMRQLNGMYTQRFNRAHQRVGHVFQGRYKSIVVDKDAYLLELSRYIVWNPVAARMVKEVGDWAWSSYRATAGDEQIPEFLTVDWVLEQFGGNKALYKQFVTKNDGITPWNLLNGSDVLGGDTFRKELEAYKGTNMRDIPKKKQILQQLSLSEILTWGETDGVWMREAYRSHGYTMQEIADFAGVHYSTVSRRIKKEDARNKT